MPSSRVRAAVAVFLLAPLPLFACSVDTAPSGLRATPPGNGPAVVFDLSHRPLPDIPAPNDIATFADPTSRTGRRLNASMVAPTGMEAAARAEFDEMEGWGTYAPIFVRFTRPAGTDPSQPAIDLDNLRRRMHDDGYEFSNDAIYVVNLKTGVPAILDMGHGNFPLSVSDQNKYWPNDPHANDANLVFEARDEAPGFFGYDASLDTDFDGVIDHPNTYGAASDPRFDGIDNVMSWYERESDSVIVRPVLPLEEKTEYAVVLTDRLVGSNGEPVKSPFPYIHHPNQRAGVAALQGILGDKSRQNYYGDIAGTGLDHVAFAWTFTTEPVFEDTRLLRDGLYGRGPFARWASEFPPDVTVVRAVGTADNLSDEPAGWQNKPECAPVANRPYIVKFDNAKGVVHDFLVDILKLREDQTALLVDSLSNVDHVVIGSFEVPYLLGDPQSTDPYVHFRVNFQTGDADVHRDKVHFWLAVPKAQHGAKQPFPVTFWRHGTAQSDVESLLHIGHMARQGLATFAIDAPGHGQYFDPGQMLLARAFLAQACLAPWVNAIAGGRAIDLNGDGVPDSGGYLWSAHILHSRDNIRQANLESMQGTRVLRSFDGTRRASQDYDGDGNNDLAGDFDSDGVPDVGGPNVKYMTAGDSFGGIMAMIQGGSDPFISAAAPISGAGGLVDVATRSSLVPDSVLEQIFSPLVVSVPAESRPPDATGPLTKCASGQRSIRLVVNDLIDSKEMEVACLTQAELDAGMTVVVSNVATKERHCARAGKDGSFRVAVPSNIGDKLGVQIYPAPSVVDSYKTCTARADAPVGRRIATWEQPATRYGAVASADDTCTSDTGCQQYRGVFYAVGSPLVAPQEGIGYMRQTPDFRRLMNLVQAAVDPSDPINFAAYYMLRPVPNVDGSDTPPRALLDVHVVGDPMVPVGAGNAFARAAGAIPFLPPSFADKFPEYAPWAAPPELVDAYGGKLPNELLVDNWVIEGQSRFARTPAGAACGVNYDATKSGCTDAPSVDKDTCRKSLFDADSISDKGMQGYDQQHLKVPLRLARLATVRGATKAELSASYKPRIAGAPFADDASGWQPNGPLVATLNAYMTPLGQHVWFIGDPCKRWDDVTYMENLIARFLGSNGQDLYYLSHPSSHGCLADRSCPFFH